MAICLLCLHAHIYSANRVSKEVDFVRSDCLDASQPILNLYVDQDLLDREYLLDNFKQRAYVSSGINVVSHGRSGELYIDGEWLDTEGIALFIEENLLGRTFVNSSKLKGLKILINIYGCNFGKGEKGKNAISKLESRLPIIISASDNVTGKDGDWKLEIGIQSPNFENFKYDYNLQCTAGPTERVFSGRVYNDINLNQIDDSEPGLSNVDVLVYEDANQNGVLDDGDNLLSTITPNGTGNYSYTSTPVVRTYADDFSGDVFFNTNNNSGTSNWTNDQWVREGNNGNFFNVRTFNNGDNDNNFTTQSVQIQNRNAGIYRTVDLSNAQDATLEFEYDWDDSGGGSLDGGEMFFIQIDPENDGTYVDLDTIIYVETEIPVTSVSIDIPAIYLGEENTRIRFITEDEATTGAGEAWWIDNVELTVTDVITHYLAITDITTYPANFSLSTDNLETAFLPNGGTCDLGNDFGLRFCLAGCPPIAEDDAVSILQGESVQIYVLANDLDTDGNIDTSSLSLISAPTNGSTILDVSTGSFIYTPVGAYIGLDQFVYEICDDTSPTPVCNTATVNITIEQRNLDPCEVANENHTYYLPYPADHLFTSLINASSCGNTSRTTLRSIVSIKCPYPGARIYYDHWEDGYEVDEYSPVTASTEVWGDGNLGNGVAPGYPTDIIPAGGSIIIDNTFNYNPRNPSNLFYDGKDRVSSNSTIALSYIAGDNGAFTFQAAKTDVYDTGRFGSSFTVPFGENLGGSFQYTSLFIRAAEDSTTVNVDIDNDGINDTTQVINQGEVLFIDGTVQEGALITSDLPVGVDVLFGGLDCYGTRQVNLFPAAFYSDVYYTPVPTTRASNPVTIYLYNSLNRVLNIDWTSNSGSGTIAVPANSSFTFPLPLDPTAYRFESQTGESYTAISVIDNGSAYDWSFNLIAANQLSNFASIAWAPGSLDGTRNDNPVWVSPVADTRVYVKYDGNLADQASLLSPCRIPYDITFLLNELDFTQIYDNADNDQSGLAVFTCDGTPIVAVYGEDPNSAIGGSPSLDVGTTIQPLCIDPVIIANNDEVATIIDVPVITDVLENDQPFLTNLDSTSVNIVSSPTNGFVVVNPDGTISYIPNAGYFGTDQYQYFVCSVDDPDLCDFATVFVTILSCTAELTEKLLFGTIYDDQNQNGVNDSETGVANVTVNIYHDIDEDGTISPGDNLLTSEVSDAFGTYSSNIEAQPAASITEDFSSGDYSGGSGWIGSWDETSESNNNPSGTGEIRIINSEVYITDNDPTLFRDFDLTTYSSASFSFDYRRDGLRNGRVLDVQVAFNGGGYTTIFTVFGNNNSDIVSINSGDIDLTPYVGGIVTLRFNPNGGWSDNTGTDDIFIDNIDISARNLPSYYIVETDEATVPDGYVATTTSPQALFVPLGGTCLRTDFGYANLCVTGLDTDSDGIADVCDLDDDNDGILDTDEHSPCDSVYVQGYDALWNFENTTDDETANNRDAQNTPGETYSTNSVTGDAAVEFDGSFFIQYSNGGFLNDPIRYFTYSFWFNPSSFSGVQYLIDEGGATNGVTIRMNGNSLEARIKEAGIIEDSESFLLGRTNIWYHVVLTYDDGDLTFYLNNEANPTLNTSIGELAGHNDGSGLGGNNNANAYGTSGIDGFTGLIDQLIHYPVALNASEIARLYFICDTDQDGIANRLDLDSDNDGILDVYEAGHNVIADSDGRISDSDAQSGNNGLDDRVETSAESNTINYTLADSELSPDGLYDPYELDSDGDTCFDTFEASISDPEQDGIAGSGVAAVDSNGLVDSVKPYGAPPNNEWQDPAVTSCPEICGDGIDNDNDGMIDCLDPDCDRITVSNIVVGPCIDQPLEDIAQVAMDINWSAPLSDTLVVRLYGQRRFIYTDVSASPQSLIFNVPADGSTNNIIESTWGYYNEMCKDTAYYDAPAPCSTDSITCNILYICGEEKPADGDAWDHGFIDYIDNNNGTAIITPILAKDEPSGLALYDPLSPATPMPVDFDDYDLIVISTTTENSISTDLVDTLKDLSQSLVLMNFDIAQDFGLTNSPGFYTFTTDLFTDNSNSTRISNYNNINANFDLVFTHIDYLNNADAYLWDSSNDSLNRLDGSYVYYDPADALTGISAGHGPRIYFGYHANGIYHNDLNNGATPTPVENWFHPTRHLTEIGKSYFDQMLVQASAECCIGSCYDITGRVFEDINYGGGDGRNYLLADASAVSSGWSAGVSGIPASRVELYDSSDLFVEATTTDATGAYTFLDVESGNYKVRVVNNTLSSNRGSNGTAQTIIPVQTYRHTGSLAVINEVGGADPTLVDAPSNTTSANFSTLSTASTVAQSVSDITVGSSDVTGVDFGFNYDVIVNTNNSGQGSLRQFILNSNELDNVDLDQEDNPSGGVVFTKDAGWETSIFMIPGAGVHTITPTTVFNQVSDEYTHITGYTQMGSAQGTIASRILTIELAGGGVAFDGFSVAASNTQISGMTINDLRHGIQSNFNGVNLFVWGNYIGSDITGLLPMGNGENGMLIQSFDDSFIGTNADGVNDQNEGNLIVDNSHGIVIRNTSNFLIAGNIIGLNKNGNASISNRFNGIFIRDATGTNIIGFDDNATAPILSNMRNVSSSNGNDGIRILGSDSQMISGNFLGTDVTGTLPFGNTNYGMQIQGANSNLIIGTDSDSNFDILERNVISGNGAGIRFLGAGTGTDNRISGNYIGVDTSGIMPLGNNTIGVEINGDYASNIVGTNGDNVNDDVEGNVISSNGTDGMRIANTDLNVIAGNKIGVGSDGISSLPNNSRGIFITSGANDNKVGYHTAMANQDELIVGNIIKNNIDVGVAIDVGLRNKISRNQIADNGSIGIDLDYDLVTPNDNGDGDNGSNDLLNFPVFTSVTAMDTFLTIAGFAPAGSIIEVFVADAGPNPNPLPVAYSTSFGEGESYLFDVVEGSGSDLDAASGSYSDDGTGSVVSKTQNRFRFVVNIAGMGFGVGAFITATATDASNNTSECSGITEVINPNCGTAILNPQVRYFRRE